MTDIVLRPYQRDFIDAVRLKFLHNKRRVVGVAPCGAGKTIMTGWMIKESLRRNKKTIFFVHRQELIRQTADTFTRLEIPHGIICSGVPMNLDLPVQIASVQTLARRLDLISPPDFLICDECHHILANTYKKILDRFPNAFLLGVTATPERMGGITLCDVFDSMVQSLSVDQLISLGNLCSFRYFAPKSNVDLSRVRSKFGDFVNGDLSNAMSDPKIIGNIVETYQRIANGLSAIVYAVDVDHSKLIANAFQKAGISAAHCDGETPAPLRDRIVDDFRRNNIKILCNAELFGEGFDVPNMQAVILARPTKSLPLYIQQSMRPLRPDPNDPNKVAIIIDHVDNYLRHGLPNTPHDWSLNPNHKKIKLITCPACKSKIVPEPINDKLHLFQCPKCLATFTIDTVSQNFSPRRKQHVDGIIDEIDVSFQPKKELSAPVVIDKPTTVEQFVSIAKLRNHKSFYWAAMQAVNFARSFDDVKHIANVCGYKSGWAWHIWQDRQAEISFKKKLQSARISC